MYFGEYPQTLKAKEVTVSDVCDEKGYYLGSDGFRYAKVIASPHESGFRFSNGEPIIAGNTYWFKVEPISWTVLEKKNGRALILCNSVIASRRFAEESNNYAESEIRAWLNGEFLNAAFTEREQERILCERVENGVKTTGYTKNEYACEDTFDKVFLMSHSEITNAKYGFPARHSESKSRTRLTSDYSRATGAYMSTEGSYYGNGYWWLRSPGDAGSFARVRVVFPSGVSDYSYYYPNGDYGSVVPALRVVI